MNPGSCEYVDCCDREGTRFWEDSPAQGWLCEEHFRQVLNAAAEAEAAARGKFDNEWTTHLESYLRENSLKISELTEAQQSQLEEEGQRWIRQKMRQMGKSENASERWIAQQWERSMMRQKGRPPE